MSDDEINGSTSTASTNQSLQQEQKKENQNRMFTFISLEICIYFAIIAFVCKILYEVYLEN